MPPPPERTESPGALDGVGRVNLYVYEPEGPIRWYALMPTRMVSGRAFTIGRGADRDIPLDDHAVSTRHAYLSADETGLLVHDLESTNHTQLNGRRVARAYVNHGDVIRVGGTDIRVLFSGAHCDHHLLLSFIEGPHMGRTIATHGCSVSVGRVNCAINLSGEGIASQHLRIDVFDPKMLFVVNLRDEAHTSLNGHPINGIGPARHGDTLQVGPHTLVLEVVGAETVERRRVSGALDPLGVLSSEDLAEVEAQCDALEMVSEDVTVVNMPSLTMEEVRPGEVVELPEMSRVMRRWPVVLGLALGAMVGLAAVAPGPQRMSPPEITVVVNDTPIQPSRTGRVVKVLSREGPVKAGAALLELEDVAVAEKLASARTRLAVPAPPLPMPVMARAAVARTMMARAAVGRRIPGVSPQALTAAKRRAARAQSQAVQAKTAFNRRELSLDEMERAQAKARRMNVALGGVQAKSRAMARAHTVAAPVMPESAPTIAPPSSPDRGALLAEIATLTAQLHYTVRAEEGGRLEAVEGAPRVGQVLVANRPVYTVKRATARHMPGHVMRESLLKWVWRALTE